MRQPTPAEVMEMIDDTEARLTRAHQRQVVMLVIAIIVFVAFIVATIQDVALRVPLGSTELVCSVLLLVFSMRTLYLRQKLDGLLDWLDEVSAGVAEEDMPK